MAHRDFPFATEITGAVIKFGECRLRFIEPNRGGFPRILCAKSLPLGTRHARTGEIHMPEHFPGTIKLRRPAGVEEEARYFAESNAGGVRHLVFVAQGSYEYGLLVAGQRGHAWGKGKVQVPAGRAVTVAPALPKGSIAIEAELDPTPAVRKRGGINAYVMRGDFGKRTVVTVGLTPDKSRPGIYRGTAEHIPPGTWMISSSPRGYVRVGRSVTVAGEAVTVRVRFERKP